MVNTMFDAKKRVETALYLNKKSETEGNTQRKEFPRQFAAATAQRVYSPMSSGLSWILLALLLGIWVPTRLVSAEPPDLLDPVFTTDPITSATEDLPYIYQVEATSPIGSEIEITAVDLPAWLTLLKTGNGRAEIYGVPTQAEVGRHTALLVASDGVFQTSQSFVVVVAQVNDPPVFRSNPLLKALKGQEYLYVIEAADEEGQALVFGASLLPPWLTIYELGPGIAVLQGIPGDFDGGAQNVVVTVSDGEFVTEQSFFIDVEPIRISSISLNGRDLQICWEAVPGRGYRVERRSLDPTGGWVRVAELESQTEFGCVVDVIPTAAAAGFYRVVEMAP